VAEAREPEGAGLAEAALAGPDEAAARGGNEFAPLAGLFARVAEARWASILGAGRVVWAGTESEVPAEAVRATAALAVDGAPAGWLRSALEAGSGAGVNTQDHRLLAAWLEGVGAAVAELLGAQAEVRAVQAGERPETGGEAPHGPVFRFALAFGRRSASAWLWLAPELLERCWQAVAETEPDAEPQAPRDPFPPLPDAPAPLAGDAIDVLLDVPLQVSVELGRAERQVRDVLGLVPGSVVELDRLAGDPLDVMVNGRRIARGEAVVVDERFAVRITEILTPEERIDRML